jgi:hypothetical protein
MGGRHVSTVILQTLSLLSVSLMSMLLSFMTSQLMASKREMSKGRKRQQGPSPMQTCHACTASLKCCLRTRKGGGACKEGIRRLSFGSTCLPYPDNAMITSDGRVYSFLSEFDSLKSSIMNLKTGRRHVSVALSEMSLIFIDAITLDPFARILSTHKRSTQYPRS